MKGPILTLKGGWYTIKVTNHLKNQTGMRTRGRPKSFKNKGLHHVEGSGWRRKKKKKGKKKKGGAGGEWREKRKKKKKEGMKKRKKQEIYK